MVDSVLSVGLQGVQAGVASAREAAQDIASATAPPADTTENTDVTADLTEAVVQLKVSELQVAASTAVIKTADEILGTLVDTKA